MDDYAQRIKKINEEIERLEKEKYDLEQQHSGFFIGVVYSGNGDYWDEFLVPLGRMTELEARKWVNENNDYCDCDCWMGCADPYFEVDEETYKKYCFLASIKKIHGPTSKYKDEIERINIRLDNIKKELIDEVGIKRPSFQHVVWFSK